jgi:hypothetical protein
MFNHPQSYQFRVIGAGLIAGQSKPTGGQRATYPAAGTSTPIPRGADEFHNTAGTGHSLTPSATISTNRIADRSANETLIRARYATTLTFVGTKGLVLECGLKEIQGLALIGDFGGAGTSNYGIHLIRDRVSFGDTVAIHGFKDVGIKADEGTIVNATQLTITGCGVGFMGDWATRVNLDSATITGNLLLGIQITGATDLVASNSFVSGSGGAAIQCQEGVTAVIDTAEIQGNEGEGIICSRATLQAPSTKVQGGLDSGVRLVQTGAELTDVEIRTNKDVGLRGTQSNIIAEGIISNYGELQGVLLEACKIEANSFEIDGNKAEAIEVRLGSNGIMNSGTIDHNGAPGGTLVLCSKNSYLELSSSAITGDNSALEMRAFNSGFIQMDEPNTGSVSGSITTNPAFRITGNALSLITD